MRLGLLFILLFLQACSQVPVREPASIENDYFFAEVDAAKSIVKVFPPEISGTSFRYYFYMELKDNRGNFVDCESREVILKDSKGILMPFKLDRILRGRYYLTLNETSKVGEAKLDLSIGKVQLKKEVKLYLKKAERNKSWIKVVKAERSGLRLRLFLGDAKGKPVELPSPPEILLNGWGNIENLEHMGEGTWEFDLVFPNDNQVMYVSIRAHGHFMADMFRVQHIEK